MKYYVDLINQTHYADIYGLFSETDKLIGTKEVVLAGRNCGAYYTSMVGKYSKRDIRKLFNEMCGAKI